MTTYIGDTFPWDNGADGQRGLTFGGKPIGGVTFYPTTPKPFRFGFLLGRFQHIHIGHEYMINQALKVCDKVMILVGSAQDDARVTNPIRNPFETHFRISLIQEIYKDNPDVIVVSIPDLTHENDHSFAWGRYVLENVVIRADQYGIKGNPDVMIYGDDEERAGWFHPEDKKGIAQLIIPRTDINISATEMRKMTVEKNFWKWRQFVNQKLHPKFNDIRDELLKVDYYRELAEKNGIFTGN